MAEMFGRVAATVASHLSAAERAKGEHFDIARAVLEAMREPTEDMVRVGDDRATYEVYDRSDGRSTFPGGSEAIWQSMVDAALNPARAGASPA